MFVSLRVQREKRSSFLEIYEDLLVTLRWGLIFTDTEQTPRFLIASFVYSSIELL